MNAFLVVIGLLVCLAGGLYAITPMLKSNAKPKNWQDGEQTYVPARLKNTMSGFKSGF